MKTLAIAAIAMAGLIGTASADETDFFQSKLVKNPGAAQAPITSRGPVRHSTNQSHDVYDTTGNYLGSDPDPTVRFLLRQNIGDE
jgi:hypothetical protein